MREGWTKQKLGDVITLEYGKPLPKDERCGEKEGFPAFGANGIKCYSREPYWLHPSVIVGRKGTAGAVNLVEGGFWPLDVTYYVTFDNKKHDRKFLYYMLSALNLPALATGVKPGINRNVVYAIEQYFPLLPSKNASSPSLMKPSPGSMRPSPTLKITSPTPASCLRTWSPIGFSVIPMPRDGQKRLLRSSLDPKKVRYEQVLSEVNCFTVNLWMMVSLYSE
nr:restriction endonuclease subunit S [Halomonas socia]